MTQLRSSEGAPMDFAGTQLAHMPRAPRPLLDWRHAAFDRQRRRFWLYFGSEPGHRRGSRARRRDFFDADGQRSGLRGGGPTRKDGSETQHRMPCGAHRWRARSRGRATSLSHFTGAHFRDGMKTFAARAISGRMDADEITAEASAQIRKIQSARIAVSHIDTHKHTHLFPKVLRPLLRAAADCGVRAVRNPFGPRLQLRSSDLLARPSLWVRYAEVRVLWPLRRKLPRGGRPEGFTTPDGTLGIVVTGALDKNALRCDCPQHSGGHVGILFAIPVITTRTCRRARRGCGSRARSNSAS